MPNIHSSTPPGLILLKVSTDRSDHRPVPCFMMTVVVVRESFRGPFAGVLRTSHGELRRRGAECTQRRASKKRLFRSGAGHSSGGVASCCTRWPGCRTAGCCSISLAVPDGNGDHCGSCHSDEKACHIFARAPTHVWKGSDRCRTFLIPPVDFLCVCVWWWSL